VALSSLNFFSVPMFTEWGPITSGLFKNTTFIKNCKLSHNQFPLQGFEAEKNIKF
jgi:hypothetical protein